MTDRNVASQMKTTKRDIAAVGALLFPLSEVNVSMHCQTICKQDPRVNVAANKERQRTRQSCCFMCQCWRLTLTSGAEDFPTDLAGKAARVVDLHVFLHQTSPQRLKVADGTLGNSRASDVHLVVHEHVALQVSLQEDEQRYEQ